MSDPRFPDRPQTKDFWRMSEGVTAMDALSAAGPFRTIAGQLCDLAAVEYVAKGRMAITAHRLGIKPRQVSNEGAWLDGFYMGLMFQKLGGHQEEE